MPDVLQREAFSQRVLDGRVSVRSTEPPTSPEDRERENKRYALMARARREFHTVLNAEAKLREMMFEDLEFRASKQWDPQVEIDRALDNRPCITINRLPLFIRQVTNAMRSSNLRIKVLPNDDGADIDTAEVFQGVIRHIEHHSDASVAYATAGDAQATIGRGFWTVESEWADDLSFDQALRIRRIRNPFSVYMDPTTQEADASDQRFCFIVEDVPTDEYDERFGQASRASLEDWAGTGNHAPDWMPEGRIRVAKWWYVDVEKVDIVEVMWPDGEVSTVREDELLSAPPMVQMVAQVLRRRQARVRVVKCAIINGATIIEGNEDKTEGRRWPGKWIPVVPVLGDEIDLNGERDLRGIVRDAKSPQVLYNYQETALAEALLTAPKAPYVGAEGQFEGHEAKWQQANMRLFPYLEYKPKTVGDQLAPPPRRESPTTNIGPIVQALQLADQDMKAVIGLYEPSLGMRSSAESGKAINALKQSGEQANSNFLDNMVRAIRFTGRILVDLIPYYYNRPRVMRIIGADEQERNVMVHSGWPQEDIPTVLPKNVDGIYDLSAGRYDVTVSAGPSQETRRQEAFQALTEIVKAVPAMFPVLGDLLVGNMDWDGAQAAAKRLRKVVPPEVRDDEDGQPEIPPEIRQQVQQIMQQAEAMAAELSEAKQVIETKQVEAQSKALLQAQDAAARERLEAMKAHARLLEVKAKTDGNAMVTALQGEIDRMLQILEQKFEASMERAKRADARAERAEERQEERADALAGRVLDEAGADRAVSREVEKAKALRAHESVARPTGGDAG